MNGKNSCPNCRRQVRAITYASGSTHIDTPPEAEAELYGEALEQAIREHNQALLEFRARRRRQESAEERRFTQEASGSRVVNGEVTSPDPDAPDRNSRAEHRATSETVDAVEQGEGAEEGVDDESEDIASASDNDSVASEVEQGEGAEEGGDGSEEPGLEEEEPGSEEEEEEAAVAGAGEGAAATASTVPDGPVTTLDINNATAEQLAQPLASMRSDGAKSNHRETTLANRIVKERDGRTFTCLDDMRMRVGAPGLQSGRVGDANFNALRKAFPLCYREEGEATAAEEDTEEAGGEGEAGEGDEAEVLLSAVGAVVRLDNEGQIDAVTGVSGSGPAYVFHMIETMAAAGVAQGLPAALSMQLAKATVAGAGALALQASETPSELRVNVTSPNGTAPSHGIGSGQHRCQGAMRNYLLASGCTWDPNMTQQSRSHLNNCGCGSICLIQKTPSQYPGHGQLLGWT